VLEVVGLMLVELSRLDTLRSYSRSENSGLVGTECGETGVEFCMLNGEGNRLERLEFELAMLKASVSFALIGDDEIAFTEDTEVCVTCEVDGV
jgi:hypothetical protein